MIAERLPELAAMSQEEKWLVYRELEEEFISMDNTELEPVKAEIAAILQARVDEYQANPESGLPWDAARARLHQRYAEWKAARGQS
ncbi:MAG: addiction module protein [Prosthecobacter sp.]|nr:addiction module protein [Prosthecobacter sp.]